MDPAILAAERGGTEVQLEILGDDIILTRKVRARTASGGSAETSPAPLTAQRFVVENSDQGQLNISAGANQEGEINWTRLLLTGRYDADIKKGDTFTWNGLPCRVTRVSPIREGETVAEAVVNG